MNNRFPISGGVTSKFDEMPQSFTNRNSAHQLYGVTAYNVGCRTNEIGVRVALGADRGQVVALVLRGAFGLVAFGLVAGLPLALLVGRFLGHQGYGMNPYNPVVIFISAGAPGFSALVASIIPAVRASSISPLDALRAE